MEQIRNYLIEAQKNREIKNSDGAFDCYQVAVIADSQDGKGVFSQFMQGGVEGLYDAYMETPFFLTYLIDAYRFSDKTDAEIEMYLKELADIISNLPMKMYYRMNEIVVKNRTNEDRERLANTCRVSMELFYTFGDMVEEEFASKKSIVENIAVRMWKEGIKLQRQWVGVKYDKQRLIECAEKIKKYEPEYILPKENLLRKFIARLLVILSKNQYKNEHK